MTAKEIQTWYDAEQALLINDASLSQAERFVKAGQLQMELDKKHYEAIAAFYAKR